MTEMKELRPAFHFFLPGVSRRPVGGYAVAYQYASLLAGAGHQVTVWHSAAFLEESLEGSATRSLLHRIRNERQLNPRHRWFDVQAGVNLRVTGRLPKPAVREGDIVVGTAAQTMRHATAVAHSGGGRAIGLIQHHEAWGVDTTYVDRTWGYPDALIVIAPWLQEHARSLGLTSFLLPNAMDDAAWPAGSPLTDRSGGIVAMLSHLQFKRPDLVKSVLARIANELELPAVAFGQMARPHDLDPRVQYVENPTHQQLQTLYQRNVAYLCASDAEGWHLPPAEATLSGAAVVSTDIGGVRASMEEDAFYASPGDADALFDAVRAVRDNLTAAQERVDRARRRLRARTPARNLSELLAVVNQVRTTPISAFAPDDAKRA